MKKLILTAAVLALAGCATPTPQELEKQETAKELLDDCLAASGLRAVSDTCQHPWIAHAGKEASAKADQRWQDSFASKGPDWHLMAAVISRNSEDVKRAIASGADVNRVFTPAELYGTKISNRHPNTPLFQAADRLYLEIVELLLQNGAKPSLEYNGQRLDVVTTSLINLQYANGGVRTGAQVGELAVKYGYKPDARALEDMRVQALTVKDPQWTHLRPFYDSQLAAATPEVRKEREALQVIYEREQAAINAAYKAEYEARKAQEAEEDAKFYRDLAERERKAKLVAQQRLEAMRSIGARVCLDKATSAGYVTYTGYVENIAPSKAQVRISHAHYTNAPSLSPGGFKPTIIWDTLQGWHLCE